MKILAQGDGGTNDSTQIKDGPENPNGFSLLILSGVRKHEGSLCCPKQTSTQAKQSTRSNNETSGVMVDIENAERDDLRKSKKKMQ
jgi:hypothetical protein